MTKEELINKLAGIEWEYFEVKEAKGGLPKAVWDTVSSFSNTNGGWIILGVKQIGTSFEITGVGNSEKLEQDFLNTLWGGKFNVPVITKQEIFQFETKTVLAFYISANNKKASLL